MLKEPVRVTLSVRLSLLSKHALYLQDIADSIALIEEFTSGMNAETYREDPKTMAAVERKLLVISEAAIRLGDEAVRLCPDQPWQKNPRQWELAAAPIRAGGCRKCMANRYSRFTQLESCGRARVSVGVNSAAHVLIWDFRALLELCPLA